MSRYCSMLQTPAPFRVIDTGLGYDARSREGTGIEPAKDGVTLSLAGSIPTYSQKRFIAGLQADAESSHDYLLTERQ
jgi:hypothetical protein